jgi:hypothetical protein
VGRTNFTEGQEILSGDLRDITKNIERGLYENVLYEMLQRKSGSAFFGNSMYVQRTGAAAISVFAGRGIQYDSSQTTPETKRRPIVLGSNSAITLTAAHATLDRIDIVSIKSDLAIGASSSRNFKNVDDGTVSASSITTRYDLSNAIVVTVGTAGASPSAPAVPSGYTKIAELYMTAASGLANQAAITDSRDTFCLGRFPMLWYPVNGAAPTTAEENLALVDLLELNASQQLSCIVKVPSTYIAGFPITMNVSAYSPGTSNKWNLQAVTTLIRGGTDALTSTTNQNTSTSGNQTNGTANLLRKVPITLTDISGQINSVAVSPGDILIVTLSRTAITSGSDDTNDVRILDGGTEGVF